MIAHQLLKKVQKNKTCFGWFGETAKHGQDSQNYNQSRVIIRGSNVHGATSQEIVKVLSMKVLLKDFDEGKDILDKFVGMPSKTLQCCQNTILYIGEQSGNAGVIASSTLQNIRDESYLDLDRNSDIASLF